MFVQLVPQLYPPSARGKEMGETSLRTSQAPQALLPSSRADKGSRGEPNPYHGGNGPGFNTQDNGVGKLSSDGDSEGGNGTTAQRLADLEGRVDALAVSPPNEWIEAFRRVVKEEIMGHKVKDAAASPIFDLPCGRDSNEGDKTKEMQPSEHA